MGDDTLVSVYTSNGPLAAEVVKGRLESAGIPAVLKYESAGRVFGLTLDRLGAVQVLVERAREQEARELLKSEN
jgi:Putative prokaryotic signal transducing protein